MNAHQSGHWVLVGRDCGYSAPSQALALALSLPSLTSDWGLVNHADLQASLGRPWTPETWRPDLARAVVGLSPEIAAAVAEGDREYSLYDGAMGILSQFNLPDVLYFLKYRDHALRPRDVEERAGRVRLALMWRNLGIGWVPSPETLDHIEAALRPKQGEL